MSIILQIFLTYIPNYDIIYVNILKGVSLMELVLLTALGVGGATVIGALIGFIFKNISHKFSDIVLAFAAGVMLALILLINWCLIYINLWARNPNPTTTQNLARFYCLLWQ